MNSVIVNVADDDYRAYRWLVCLWTTFPIYLPKCPITSGHEVSVVL